MPVTTRSATKYSPEEREIAEILCQLKYSNARVDHTYDDTSSIRKRTQVVEDEESEYVPSDSEEEDVHTHYVQKSTVTVDEEESEYVPSDSEEEEDVHKTTTTVDEEESEYVPSDSEEEEEEDAHVKNTQSVTQIKDNESEYEPSDTEDESEYEPSDEDIARDIICKGCSDFSRGSLVDSDFFSVCERVMRGDYGRAFTTWALKLAPVQAVVGY